MSTGLMSCVRENSPPLEMATGGETPSTGSLSPAGNASDQQKRRRFHPLRNLRRIFRRRTLTTVDTITTNIQSESLPSSSQLSPTPTVIASVPAHNLTSTILPYSGDKNPSQADVTAMSSTAYTPPPLNLTSLSSSNREIASNENTSGNCDRFGGVPVMLPFSISSSASGGFYNLHHENIALHKNNEEHKHGDSNSNRISIINPGNDDLDDGREMTDYQRSLSEGRLVESDFNREVLSQSHDSVFSESATASSLSIVLKAELFDVLRKRRNRPDASDEDLGLPRSPTTPQRKDQTAVNNQSEVSSLSLLSMASSDLDDELSSNYGNSSGGGGMGGTTSTSGLNNANCSGINSSGFTDKINSSISSKDTSKTSDELDFDISAEMKLSHSAARHKMAVRPKKKGPTRHRRPIESTVLPTTPEVNEDMLKVSFLDVTDVGIGNHSAIETTNEVSSQNKRAKLEKTSAINSTSSSKCSIRNISVDENAACSSTTSTLEKKDEGFFRRLLHRNSKKVKKQLGESQSDHVFEDSNKQLDEYHQKVEETRQEIRKEILSEAKASLSAMLNTFILSPDHEKEPENDREQEYEHEILPKIHKPKSGPAARQRIIPKDLSTSPLPDVKENHAEKLSSSSLLQGIQPEEIKYYKYSDEMMTSNFEFEVMQASDQLKSETQTYKSSEISFDKQHSSCIEESFKSHTNFRECSEHFEKKEKAQPKIVGLSPFQQKICRAEISTLDYGGRPIPKQRKSVEKSKSFRYYSEETDNKIENNLKKHENVPSLPDLSYSRKKVGDCNDESEFMPLSLSFEINDNNLLNQHHHHYHHNQVEELPLSQSIYTKNIILTTSKPTPAAVVTKSVINPCNQNITEIEENIDKLVKSPFVTVLRKSTSNGGDTIETKNNNSNIKNGVSKSTASARKTDTVINENEEKTEKIIEKSIMSTSTSSISKMDSATLYRINNDTKAISTENLNKVEFRNRDRVSNNIDLIDRKPIEKLESTESLMTKVEMRNKERKSMSAALSMNNVIKSRRNSSVLEKFENNNQIPEFMKIQLNRVDASKAKCNVVLAKNVKETEDKEIIRRFSSENVEISDSNRSPLPPNEILLSKRNTSISVDDIPKSPIRKSDEEKIILRTTENTQTKLSLYERKKSVTDEKLKYERKIEELRSEWKKSYSEENEKGIICRRKSTDEESGVVLRKKSFALNSQSSNNNKEDTPELMKVFARRSLKLKDEEMQTFEELEKSNSLKKLSKNLDSDKENQSSSEEKLDKLPKVEIMIQQNKLITSSGGSGCSTIKSIDGGDKNRTSTILNDSLKKPNTVFSPSAPVAPTMKTTYISPIRYSSIVGYRNQTNFNGKSINLPPVSTITSSTPTSLTYEPNNNTNTITTPIANTGLNNNINNNNGLNKRGLRHTIGPTTHHSIATTTTPTMDQSNSNNNDCNEFKGILQRRAEWEKRAKEALK